MCDNKYLSGKEASKILGVHVRTLYQWDEKGKIDTIRTPGNKRLYNVEKFLNDRKNTDNINSENEIIIDENLSKSKIIYARASSNGQKMILKDKNKN